MTGLLLPDFKLYQVKVDTDYWALEKNKWQFPILKSKDWKNWTFDKISQEIARFKKINAHNPQIISYLKEKEQDTRLTKKLVGYILKTIKDKVEELNADNFNTTIQKYSCAPLFYMMRAKRLTEKIILEKYSTPNKVLELHKELSKKKSNTY